MTATKTPSVLPLAALTAVAMLATDLFLPAVPSLPTLLGCSVEQAQYTLSGFLATLALGQLFWGWTSDRFGESWVIAAGTSLLIVGGVACALAPNISLLIFFRLIQGLGAGAPAVAVPSLIRKRLGEVESIRAIGSVASIEAIVPAIGPVLGAGLIAISNWRVSFGLLAAATLLLIPFLMKIVRAHATGTKAPRTSYLPLFGNTEFLRFAFSYAIMFGALILLVMTAPQIIVSWFQLKVYYFSLLQVAGITCFIVCVKIGNHLVDTRGISSALRFGALLQMGACAGMLTMGILNLKSFWLLVLLWCVFNGSVGVRGPSTFTRSLSNAGSMAGKASGLLMFFSFGICSIATTVVAQYLQHGFLPLAVAMTGMTAVSVALLGLRMETERTCP